MPRQKEFTSFSYTKCVQCSFYYQTCQTGNYNNVMIVVRIVSMYEQQKDVIFERLDEILDTSSNDMPEWVSISVFTLLDNMAKNEPEVKNRECMY